MVVRRFVGPVAFVWAAVYVYIGVTAITPAVAPRGRWDLVAHAAATALLAVLFFEWLRHRPVSETPPAARSAVVGACVLGLAVEVVQALVPHRGFEVADLVADAVGAVGAVWLHPRVAAVISPISLSTSLVVSGVVASVAAIALTSAG